MQLAAVATVLTYDRAGSGRSGNRSHRTVADMADALDALIHAHSETDCYTTG